MSTTTANYGLKKPIASEYFTVEDQNGNMDLIDTALKNNADNIAAEEEARAAADMEVDDLISNMSAVATQTSNGLMSSTDKVKLDGVAANANNYVHPTTAGNKHIPSGGATDQIMGYGGALGVASWIQQLASKSLLGSSNQTSFGVTNVDAVIALLVKAKWYGKYTSISGANATSGSDISFSTESNDDLGMSDLTSYPTRLTVPSGINKIKLKLKNIVIPDSGTSVNTTLTIYKNGVATSEVFHFRTMSGTSSWYQGFSGSFESSVLSVSSGDYFTVRFSGTLTASTLSFEAEVMS